MYYCTTNDCSTRIGAGTYILNLRSGRNTWRRRRRRIIKKKGRGIGKRKIKRGEIEEAVDEVEV